MRSARQQKPSLERQLTMALDLAKLRGMTAADRNAAIARLASLLLEAAGIVPTEDVDDRV